MRLINTQTLEMEDFQGDDSIPPYAIMSHTWGKQEISLQDLSKADEGWKNRDGYRKLKFGCDQAASEGLEWIWLDTCCIDKTSSAELSEAINSMFRWYSQAAVCYAYLSDVWTCRRTHLAKSRWFRRGWTLQELIAPPKVNFYSNNWELIGDKQNLAATILNATGIDKSSLLGGDLDRVSVAKKMSWASNRSTTRVEDRAYCLLGIFSINLPLLYGERDKAFRRLQEAIAVSSNDHSLYAWGMKPKLTIVAPELFLDEFPRKDAYDIGFFGGRCAYLNTNWGQYSRTHWNFGDDLGNINLHGLFARSPEDFMNSGSVVPCKGLEGPKPILHGTEASIHLPILRAKTRDDGDLGLLTCHIENSDVIVAILVMGDKNGIVGRFVEPVGIPVEDTCLCKRGHLISLVDLMCFKEGPISRHTHEVSILIDDGFVTRYGYSLSSIECSKSATPVGSDGVRIGLGTEGRKAILHYQAPEQPSFFILLGAFRTVSAPGYKIRPLARVFIAEVEQSATQDSLQFLNQSLQTSEAIEHTRTRKLNWYPAASKFQDVEVTNTTDYVLFTKDNGPQSTPILNKWGIEMTEFAEGAYTSIAGQKSDIEISALLDEIIWRFGDQNEGAMCLTVSATTFQSTSQEKSLPNTSVVKLSGEVAVNDSKKGQTPKPVRRKTSKRTEQLLHSAVTHCRRLRSSRFKKNTIGGI